MPRGVGAFMPQSRRRPALSGRRKRRGARRQRSEPLVTERVVAPTLSMRSDAAPAASWAPFALVALQICVWTALGALFEGSIDADVAEGVVDGPEWRLSYLRHPPLSSWLSGVASTTGPWRYLVLFAIAVAFGCCAFALVSLFIRRVDGSAASLVALLAGLGSPYATYWPLKFNHNIGVMPFWALVLWTAWNAFEGGSLASWALFGAAVGFSLWAKYAILHLVAPLGVAFLLTPEWRKRLAGPGPWLAAAIAVAIVAPQAIDVARNGATPLRWALHTTPSGVDERISWMALFIVDAALANVPMALVAWAAVGLCYALVRGTALTLLQRLTEDRVLSRVLGVLETAFVAGIGIGAIVAPALVASLGTKGALIASGVFLPFVAVLSRPSLRNLEAGAPVPGESFQLLRANPIFAPMPIGVTESLTRALREITVPADTTVIRQGDPGDLWFLIAEGEVEVVKDGVFQARLGKGDAFGEIALLRDVPRTATVRTLAPSHLLALVRDRFLAAVTGLAESHEAAQEIATNHLNSGSPRPAL